MTDGYLRIKTKIDNTDVNAQLSYLKYKLESATEEAKLLKETMAKGEAYPEAQRDLLKLESEAQRLSSQISNIEVKTNDVGYASDKASTKVSSSMDKGIRSLKRFALSLFSIQSIYALISKASGAYMSQNTKLADKMQSVWVGLGSILSPVIEYLNNILLKGLGYLNVFVKALTGVDLIAKANAKALKKQADAQKEVNKQTYDFDEMRTVSDSSTSSSSNSVITIDIPDLDEGLVKKLQDLAKWLKENWSWIKKVGVVLLETFGLLAVTSLISNIGGITGALSGLATLLLAVAAVWVISVVVEGVNKAISDLNYVKGVQDLIASADTTNKKMMIENYEKYLAKAKETNKVEENRLNYLSWQADELYSIFDSETASKKNKQDQLDLLKTVNQEYSDYYDMGLLDKDSKNKYLESLQTQIKMMDKLGQNTDALKTKYKMLTNTDYKVKVSTEVDTSELDNAEKKVKKSLFSGIFSSITSGLKSWAEDLGKSTGISNMISSLGKLLNIKGYALGGIVTQPTRALIGEAGYPEAVVPMTQDYLSTLAQLIGQYSGNNGSSSVNVYLDGRLIQRQIAQTTNQLNFTKNGG